MNCIYCSTSFSNSSSLLSPSDSIIPYSHPNNSIYSLNILSSIIFSPSAISYFCISTLLSANQFQARVSKHEDPLFIQIIPQNPVEQNNIIPMTTHQHKCAFHPAQNIVNFCRSPGCFLPMCPTCIKIHSEEHRLESTYGQFENINTVVGEIQYNINSLDKLLQGMIDDFGDAFEGKKRIETDLKKKIAEAKGKLMQQIERYFDDIEASLSKSITNFKEITNEQFVKVDREIEELRRVLKSNLQNLHTERSLKTVITYHIDDYLSGWKADVKKIEAKINEINDQSAAVVIDQNIITEVMEKLDQYLAVSYEGYCQKGFYAKEYSKAKIGSTSRVGTIHNE